MKLVSWNVNGIRAVLSKGFHESIARIDPDVLCLQEIRALPEQVELELPGYELHWNSAKRKGYAGTATFTRIKPMTVTRGMGLGEHDQEGRITTLEFDDYHLVNVYTPNSGKELARLEYRTKEWDPEFLGYCRKLDKKKPVIFCGDLNVAHKDIDIHDPKSNAGSAGFTDEERANFDRIVQAGFIDTFREFTKEGGHYTWWSYIMRGRAKNRGWRIDYFCISPGVRERLKSATILSDVMGSDHCPVAIELE
jgi:exodeoxyribonuclease-3